MGSLKNIKVDPSKTEALSVEFFSSSNPHRLLDSNKAFSAELQEELAHVPGYSEDLTLKVFLRVCEGLILKWQRADFDNLNRGEK